MLEKFISFKLVIISLSRRCLSMVLHFYIKNQMKVNSPVMFMADIVFTRQNVH